MEARMHVSSFPPAHARAPSSLGRRRTRASGDPMSATVEPLHSARARTHEAAFSLSPSLPLVRLGVPFRQTETSARARMQGVAAEGAGPVAEAEALALQSLSSHVRAVVATLGGHQGAAAWHDKWRHLHAGFTVWLSKNKAANVESAREEAKRNVQDGDLAYTNADVIVKLVGWDKNHAREVALGCLRALKQLILSDKQITGKKSLYIRLGCRGDWPNIKPPGWDPSNGH